jgi:hypothetical protein
MSHFKIGSNEIEMAVGPAAGYGSIEKSLQAGGAKRKSRKNHTHKPARKSRKVAKKSRRNNLSKSKRANKVSKRTRSKTLRRKLEKCYKKVQTLRKRLHRHGMKGGSSMEAVSNVPNSVGYEVPAGALSPNESYLANPAPISLTGHHNMDNYNHYDGSSHSTNTYNQDVVA